MANITPELNDVLFKKHEVRLRPSPSRVDQITDEFLKEAYRIVCTSKTNHALL